MINFNLQLFGGRGSSSGQGGGTGGQRNTQPKQKAYWATMALKGDDADERAYGLVRSMDGTGWYAKNGVVSKAEDLGGEYMTEVNIKTSKKGYFKTEFIYSDGTSYKETYDSVSAVNQAANAFFRRMRKG